MWVDKCISMNGPSQFLDTCRLLESDLLSSCFFFSLSVNTFSYPSKLHIRIEALLILSLIICSKDRYKASFVLRNPMGFEALSASSAI